MALKLKVAKLEDVDEKFRSLYVQRGTEFVLDAEADPDLAKLAEFRDNNRKMKEQLEAWVALGMTPEQAKAKLAEIKQKRDDDDNKNLSAKQLEEKYQKQLTDAQAEADRKLREAQAKLDAYEVIGPLRQAMLTAGAIASEVDDFLELPSVKKRYRKGDDGKLQFLDEQGDPILGATAAKFAETLRKERPRFFEPVKPGGSGQKTSEPPAQKAEKSVERDDLQRAVDSGGVSLEDLASGKVAVVAEAG
jgi:hypothetical protein